VSISAHSIYIRTYAKDFEIARSSKIAKQKGPQSDNPLSNLHTDERIGRSGTATIKLGQLLVFKLIHNYEII